MITWPKKRFTAWQAAQKAKDAMQEYFEVRFAIRNGDKNAKDMVADYVRRYSAWISNIRQLNDYLKDWS